MEHVDIELMGRMIEAKRVYYSKCVDAVNVTLNSITDIKRDCLYVQPWSNRYDQVSIYVRYLGFEIRVSDHNKNLNFDTSNYHVLLNEGNDFLEVKEYLPKLIKRINDNYNESVKKRDEEIAQYNEKKNKDIIEIKAKRVKELDDIKKEAVVYMEQFECNPNKNLIQNLVDKFIEDYLNVEDYPEFDRRNFDKIKEKFAFPNSKARKSYINNIFYKKEKEKYRQ